MAKNQWDYEQASPANRWMLKHVFMAPAGLYRFMGVAFLGIAVLLAGVAWWERASPAGPADPDFFPSCPASLPGQAFCCCSGGWWSGFGRVGEVTRQFRR